MSEYVEISTSPGDIIRIANSLSARGEQLTEAVGDIRRAIGVHESKGETFPRDQFTTPFLEHYHEAVPGADGKTVPANLAVQQSATYCGEKLTQIGEVVNVGMTNYQATDDRSGDDIARAV